MVGIAVEPGSLGHAEAGAEAQEVVPAHAAVGVDVPGHRHHHQGLVVVAARAVLVAVQRPCVGVVDAVTRQVRRVEALAEQQLRQVPPGRERLAVVGEVALGQVGQVRGLAGRVVVDRQVLVIEALADVVAEDEGNRRQLVRGGRAVVAHDAQDGRRPDVHRDALRGLAAVVIDHGDRHAVHAGLAEEVIRLVDIPLPLGRVQDRLQQQRNGDPVAEVDRGMERIAGEVRRLAREAHRLAVVAGLRPRQQQLRPDVAHRDGEVERVRPRVVVGQRDGDGVDAVVGVLVRAVERAECRRAGPAGRVDRRVVGVGRRGVAPVDVVRERLAVAEAGVLERRDVLQGQHVAFLGRLVGRRRNEGRGDVRRRDRHLPAAGAAVLVRDRHLDGVGPVVLRPEVEVPSRPVGDDLPVARRHVPQVGEHVVLFPGRVVVHHGQVDQVALADDLVLAGGDVLRRDVRHLDRHRVDGHAAVVVGDGEGHRVRVADVGVVLENVRRVRSLDGAGAVAEVPRERQQVVAGIRRRGVELGLLALVQLGRARQQCDGRRDVVDRHRRGLDDRVAVVVHDRHGDGVGAVVVVDVRQRGRGHPVGIDRVERHGEAPGRRVVAVVHLERPEAEGLLKRPGEVGDPDVDGGRGAFVGGVRRKLDQRQRAADRHHERVGGALALGELLVRHEDLDGVLALVGVRVRQLHGPRGLRLRHRRRAVAVVDGHGPAIPPGVADRQRAGQRVALGDGLVALGVDGRRHVVRADLRAVGEDDRVDVRRDRRRQRDRVRAALGRPALAREEREARRPLPARAVVAVALDGPFVGERRVGEVAHQLLADGGVLGAEVQVAAEGRQVAGRGGVRPGGDVGGQLRPRTGVRDAPQLPAGAGAGGHEVQLAVEDDQLVGVGFAGAGVDLADREGLADALGQHQLPASRVGHLRGGRGHVQHAGERDQVRGIAAAAARVEVVGQLGPVAGGDPQLAAARLAVGGGEVQPAVVDGQVRGRRASDDGDVVAVDVGCQAELVRVGVIGVQLPADGLGGRREVQLGGLAAVVDGQVTGRGAAAALVDVRRQLDGLGGLVQAEQLDARRLVACAEEEIVAEHAEVARTQDRVALVDVRNERDALAVEHEELAVVREAGVPGREEQLARVDGQVPRVGPGQIGSDVLDELERVAVPREQLAPDLRAFGGEVELAVVDREVGRARALRAAVHVGHELRPLQVRRHVRRDRGLVALVDGLVAVEEQDLAVAEVDAPDQPVVLARHDQVVDVPAFRAVVLVVARVELEAELDRLADLVVQGELVLHPEGRGRVRQPRAGRRLGFVRPHEHVAGSLDVHPHAGHVLVALARPGRGVEEVVEAQTRALGARRDVDDGRDDPPGGMAHVVVAAAVGALALAEVEAVRRRVVPPLVAAPLGKVPQAVHGRADVFCLVVDGEAVEAVLQGRGVEDGVADAHHLRPGGLEGVGRGHLPDVVDAVRQVPQHVLAVGVRRRVRLGSAPHGNAQVRIAHEEERLRVEPFVVALGGEQLHPRAARALEVDQRQVVAARVVEVERLDRVAQRPRVRVRHGEGLGAAADLEAEAVVAGHAEAPVAGRGDLDDRRRPDDVVVLRGGEARERPVGAEVRAHRTVGVVDGRDAVAVDRRLPLGVLQDVQRGVQGADHARRLDVLHGEGRREGVLALHRDAQVRMAQQAERPGVERRVAALGGEELHLRPDGALEVDQRQLVAARLVEVERLDRVGRGTQAGVLHGERLGAAGDLQPEAVVAVDAEAPVAGRGNVDRRRRPHDEVVLLVDAVEAREPAVQAEVPVVGAAIQVVDGPDVLAVDGALERGIGQEGLGGLEALDESRGLVERDGEARHDLAACQGAVAVEVGVDRVVLQAVVGLAPHAVAVVVVELGSVDGARADVVVEGRLPPPAGIDDLADIRRVVGDEGDLPRADEAVGGVHRQRAVSVDAAPDAGRVVREDLVRQHRRGEGHHAGADFLAVGRDDRDLVDVRGVAVERPHLARVRGGDVNPVARRDLDAGEVALRRGHAGIEQAQQAAAGAEAPHHQRGVLGVAVAKQHVQGVVAGHGHVVQLQVPEVRLVQERYRAVIPPIDPRDHVVPRALGDAGHVRVAVRLAGDAVRHGVGAQGPIVGHPRERIRVVPLDEPRGEARQHEEVVQDGHVRQVDAHREVGRLHEPARGHVEAEQVLVLGVEDDHVPGAVEDDRRDRPVARLAEPLQRRQRRDELVRRGGRRGRVLHHLRPAGHADHHAPARVVAHQGRDVADLDGGRPGGLGDLRGDGPDPVGRQRVGIDLQDQALGRAVLDEVEVHLVGVLVEGVAAQVQAREVGEPRLGGQHQHGIGDDGPVDGPLVVRRFAVEADGQLPPRRLAHRLGLVDAQALPRPPVRRAFRLPALIDGHGEVGEVADDGVRRVGGLPVVGVPARQHLVRAARQVAEPPLGVAAVLGGQVVVVAVHHAGDGLEVAVPADRLAVGALVPPVGVEDEVPGGALLPLAVVERVGVHQRADVGDEVVVQQREPQVVHPRQRRERHDRVARHVQPDEAVKQVDVVQRPDAAPDVRPDAVVRRQQHAQVGQRLEPLQVEHLDPGAVQGEVLQAHQAQRRARVGHDLAHAGVRPAHVRADRTQRARQVLVVREVQAHQVRQVLDALQALDARVGEVHVQDRVDLARPHGDAELRQRRVEQRHVQRLGDGQDEHLVLELVVEDRVDVERPAEDDAVGRGDRADDLVVVQVADLDVLGEERVVAALAEEPVDLRPADEDILALAAVEAVHVVGTDAEGVAVDRCLERRHDLDGELQVGSLLGGEGVVHPQEVRPGVQPAHVHGAEALVEHAAVAVHHVDEHAVTAGDLQAGGRLGRRVGPVGAHQEVRFGRHPQRDVPASALQRIDDLLRHVEREGLRPRGGDPLGLGG